MAGGLRLRSEAILVSSKGTNYVVGTQVLVAASAAVGIQRVGIYRCVIEAIAASTIQFQDTSGGALSGIYSLGALGFFILDTPINGDPWWQAAAGLGVQLVIGGTGPVAADIWYGMGA